MENIPLVIYESDMPLISFKLFGISAFYSSWTSHLQILFVSEGGVNLQIGDSLYSLKEKDLILISPMEIYSVLEGDGIAALFSIDLSAV